MVEPETRVDAVPQEEPAVARSQWRAVNDGARAITGNLRVSLEGKRGGPRHVRLRQRHHRPRPGL